MRELLVGSDKKWVAGFVGTTVKGRPAPGQEKRPSAGPQEKRPSAKPVPVLRTPRTYRVRR